jgi:uncharacterized protein YjbI with pentapeptide repeats
MAKLNLRERLRRRAEAARGASPWRILLWGVAGILLLLGIAITIIQPKEMGTNLAAEAAGLAFTVLVIDVVAARHSEEREKRDLILQMGSPDNAFAREAVRKLNARGWLVDGSLRGANLDCADLHGASLCKADLRGAKLGRGNLIGADVRGAYLDGARLYLCKLNGADLEGAGLRGAFLYEADLSGARLYEADLSGADLRLARLDEAMLYKANLRGADLRLANLERANLRLADLYEAKVPHEQLEQAITLVGATLPDGTKYRRDTPPEPEPTVPETEIQDAEGQPTQPDDLAAGDSDREVGDA